MTSKTFFRLLVAASFLSGIACALTAQFPGKISEDWRIVIEWNGNGGFYERLESFTLPTPIVARVTVMAIIVTLLLFLLSVAVGLFLFWRFARFANLLLTVLSVVIAPWAGLVILLPIEAGLFQLTMLCEGAVIALSYTTPIKDYFERR